MPTGVLTTTRGDAGCGNAGENGCGGHGRVAPVPAEAVFAHVTTACIAADCCKDPSGHSRSLQQSPSPLGIFPRTSHQEPSQGSSSASSKNRRAMDGTAKTGMVFTCGDADVVATPSRVKSSPSLATPWPGGPFKGGIIGGGFYENVLILEGPFGPCKGGE